MIYKIAAGMGALGQFFRFPGARNTREDAGGAERFGRRFRAAPLVSKFLCVRSLAVSTSRPSVINFTDN
jgi:hypothetical protein